ncbi:MAG: VWA domain-containing protein [Bacteroidota bacterium]|nr:VWA domain-containing protein [Bacteroidota bacterium]
MKYTLRSAQLLVLSIVLVLPVLGFGQRLGFVTSTPRIDSFPVVRLKMTATYNGSLPQPGVLPSNLKVTEDKVPVNPDLIGCDESGQAAVVFCVDASTSIKASAGDTWDVYTAYFKAYDRFISAIPSASRYALVAFTDQVIYYPGPIHLNGFYSGGNSADSTAFQNALNAQSFTGFTDVDTAIHLSAALLQNQPFQQKAIVLITDDAIINTPYYDSLLNVLGITLYVMELGTDPKSGGLNQLLSHSTGGVFMQAKDTAQYAPTMGQLAEYVFGEHCLIRYVSANPCPWMKLHDISLTLNYKGLSRSLIEQYTLGRNIYDFDPPLITEISPSYTSRLVMATENFPCTRGLRYFQDSLLQNFFKLSQSPISLMPNYASDSLVVSDSLQPGRAVFIASDSGNNRTRKVVIYTPKPDTLVPLINVAQSSFGNYQLVLSETRPWDRGLSTARLRPGAQNLVLDSVSILTRRIGQAWLHVPNPAAASSGCLEALDSSGNIGDYCIKRDSATGDTLPPIITQDPIFSPRLQMTGNVREQRFKDLGIKNITILPAPNTGAAKITSVVTNRFETFTVPILDSLQPARAPITASDSASNVQSDTLRYDPLPDVSAPICSVEIPNQKTRIFHASDAAAWDRGILSLSLIGAANNLTVGPVVFTDVNHAQMQFTVIDPFTVASAIVHAVDSVGHTCETTISIDPLSKPLVPFGATNIVDFGTVYAPANIPRTFQIRNPNESPAVVTKVTQTGDVPVFSTDMVAPISFQPFETKTFTINFTPSLLGSWLSDFTLSNDTMALASVRALGRSIGDIHISIDTVSVPRTQVKGKFRVSISATPAPINLDTISFTLNYDSDLALLQNPVTDCSGSNPLCNYFINPTPLPSNKMRYDLIRNNRSIDNSLSFATTTFDVPFTCSIARHDTTALIPEDIFISQGSTASSVQGMLSTGSECGDATLRAFLNGNLPAFIGFVSPNPASSIVTVGVEAKVKGEAKLSLIDDLGVVKLRMKSGLNLGTNEVPLKISSLPSGSYQLILSQENTLLGSRTITIVR